MSENVFINVKNRSLTITAEVEIPKAEANGVILAQAGRFGGWSSLPEGWQADLHLQLSRSAAIHRRVVAALPAGKATIRFEFAYDGGGIGKGGTGTIFVNGQKVAEGRIERPNAASFQRMKGPMLVWMMALRLAKITGRRAEQVPAKSPR